MSFSNFKNEDNKVALAMDLKNEKKMKKEAKEYAAFMTEIAGVMTKHKVTDMLCVFGMNEAIRNSYLMLGDKENPLYCNISDGIDAWIKTKF